MTNYKRWNRKPDSGPGHVKIWVLHEGPTVARQGDGQNHVQCATMDRIPFMMKAKDLFARYELEIDRAEEIGSES